MPSKKISQMDSLSAVDDATLFPVVDGGTNWSVTAALIAQYVSNTTGGGVTEVDAVSPISSTGGDTPTITITAASNTTDGMVTQGTQTFAGDKTFNGSVTVNTFLNVDNASKVVLIECAAGQLRIFSGDTPNAEMTLDGSGVNIIGSGVAYQVNGTPLTTGGGMSNPMTTEGDMIFQSSGSPAALAIGTNGSVLTSNGTDPTWQDLDEFVAIGSPVSGGTNYEVLTIDVSGNLSQISPSTDGFVLTSNGTSAAATFQAIPALDIGDPITAGSPFQILSTDGGGDLDQIPPASAGYVLTSNGSSALPTFQAPADVTPMTTEGDMIYQSVGSAVRLPIGTTGQVLTVISGDPVWSGIPAPGSTGNVVFNNGGALDASAGLTFSPQVLSIFGSGTTGNANLQIYNATNTGYVNLATNAGTGYNFYFPAGGMGTSGQFLQTDGSSQTTWATPDAAPITYSAGTNSDWSGSSPPTTLAAAIDRIAAALTTLGQAP